MHIGNLSNIELLIHCHVSAAVHPRIDAPAIQEGVAFLLRHDMIRETAEPQCYGSTLKGAFYLRHLMHTPFPEVTFSIPKA